MTDSSVRMPLRVPRSSRPIVAREGRGAARRDRPVAGAFRLPVVLCYFEGLTLDEAATGSDGPAGTVRSRLARARDKLRRGLTRRGVVLPAAALAAGLEPSVRLGVRLIRPVRHHDPGRDPVRGRTGRRQPVGLAVTLAREVLRSMLVHKLRLIAIDLAAPRRRRHRRGVSDSLPGAAG